MKKTSFTALLTLALLVGTLQLGTRDASAQLVYRFTPDQVEAQARSDREVKAALCGYGSYSLYVQGGGECGAFYRGLYAIHKGERSFHRSLYRQRWLKVGLLGGIVYGQARKTAGQYKEREYGAWVHQGQFIYQTSLGWYVYSQDVTAWEALGVTLVADAVLNLAIAKVFDYKEEQGEWDIRLLGRDYLVPSPFANRRITELAIGTGFLVVPNLVRLLNSTGSGHREGVQRAALHVAPGHVRLTLALDGIPRRLPHD